MKEGVPENCWREIGVWGDNSCSRLAEVDHCHNCEIFNRAGRALFDRPAPVDYLKEWAERLAQPKPNEQEKPISFLIFATGGEWFAIESFLSIEVIDASPVFPVPFRTNETLLGLSNYRGDLIPTISLKAILSNEGDTEYDTIKAVPRNLVLSSDRKLWIAPVDHVMGITSLSRKEFLAPPVAASVAEPNFISTLFHYKGLTVSVIDYELLFTHINRNCL